MAPPEAFVSLHAGNALKEKKPGMTLTLPLYRCQAPFFAKY